MSLRDILPVIESHEFAARLNVASDFNTFSAAMAAEESFQAMRRELALADRIAERVLELLRRRVDVRYENPWDAAIAAYLLALCTSKPELAELVAANVLQASQLWWATKIARHVVSEQRTDSSDAVSGFAGLHATCSLRADESMDLIVWLPVASITVLPGVIHSKSGFASSSRAQNWLGAAGYPGAFRASAQNERAA